MRTFIALIITLIASSAYADKRNGINCESHGECGDQAVCREGKCESALGRVYTVTIGRAKIAEKKNSGHSWDAGGGLPDPKALAYFPERKKVVSGTRPLKNTLKPKWNHSFNITVIAKGQSLTFCFYDADALSSDPIHVGEGQGNCLHLDDIIGFIRTGRLKVKPGNELRKVVVTIRRKGDPKPGIEGKLSIGVPVCDEYLHKYVRCLKSRKISKGTRKAAKAGLKTMWEAWVKAAETEAGREGLSNACKMAMDAAKRSFSSFGCEW